MVPDRRPVKSRVLFMTITLALLMTASAAMAQSSSYTHEPAGFTTFASSSLDSFTGNGWNIVNSAGDATLVPGSGTLTPNSVGQWLYPIGFAGGSAPATMYHALPTPFDEGFVGVMWKASNPWQGHSSFVNKIFFLLGGSCGNLIPIMYGPNGGPYHLRVAPEWGNWSWLTGNVNDPAVTLGVWHKIELYFKYSTGVVRWWLDGTLIGDYSNLTFPSSGCFAEFQFSPTWGGVGDTKTENDFFWFDDAYISRPGGTPSCTFSLASSSVSPPATATTGSVGVTASVNTCAWTAASNASWITITGGSSGTGSGTVSYSVAANTSASPRSGTMTIAGQTFTVNQAGASTSTSPPPGTMLFLENFEDGNVASRGWYDNTTVLLSTTEHIPGSTSSIQYTFNQGATTPTAGSALRHTFTPSDSVYLGYWVKYSTNWVGSQKTYHPHEFHFLTTLDGIWSGLSFDHLTTYIEENGGTPLIGIQDGSNIDQTKIGVDLTKTTENRGVAGCNGSSDGYPDNCYLAGSSYVNEKKWRAAAQYFTDSPGPNYKSDWHFIEAFVKMNSIVGGKGVNDGVIQYWFDGQLVLDYHDILLRTGANATMQFNQFIIAPYIGDGSPVTQSMWVDNLVVGTGKPAAPAAPTNLRISSR